MSTAMRIKKSSEWATLPSGPTKMRFLRLRLEGEEKQEEEECPDAEEKKAATAMGRTTFLCIPGNPGNDRFYERFGEHLLQIYAEKTGHRRAEFLSIAHANHVPLEELNEGNRRGKGRDEDEWKKQSSQRFNLDEQIELKAEFCDAFLDIEEGNNSCNNRVYLIGHSIGAYISLRILPRLLANGHNVVSCFCLFPTVEQMADTPNGKWIGPVVKIVDRFDRLFHFFLATLFHFVPNKLKRWLCARVLDPETPECVHSAVVELTHPLVARNIAHMANHELHVVRDFDHHLLLSSDHEERCVFFYGQADKWAPLELAERMRQRLPAAGRVLVDPSGAFEHAFVLRHSREMAVELVEMICRAA